MVTRLTEVYRAAKDGGIVTLCDDIRRGESLFVESDYYENAVFGDDDDVYWQPKEYQGVEFINVFDPAELAEENRQCGTRRLDP